MHPATRRTALAAVSAIGVPVDVGFVYPPKPGAERGRGVWTGRDLDVSDVVALLPRAAAANVDGAAIYLRLGPACRQGHPGTVMLDDLTQGTVAVLAGDGFEPCLVVETSPLNFQCWIKLSAAGPVPYGLVHSAMRHLSERYQTDPRAVSPLQPGRLPGFTNRKRKYLVEGQYPFVRLTATNPGRIATSGAQLLHDLGDKQTQPRRAGGASLETPPVPANPAAYIDADEAVLDGLYTEERNRVLGELRRGSRPASAASGSELDFAFATRSLRLGLDGASVAGWLRSHRPDKAVSYAERTVAAAERFLSGLTDSPRR